MKVWTGGGRMPRSELALAPNKRDSVTGRHTNYFRADLLTYLGFAIERITHMDTILILFLIPGQLGSASDDLFTPSYS